MTTVYHISTPQYAHRTDQTQHRSAGHVADARIEELEEDKWWADRKIVGYQREPEQRVVEDSNVQVSTYHAIRFSTGQGYDHPMPFSPFFAPAVASSTWGYRPDQASTLYPGRQNHTDQNDAVQPRQASRASAHRAQKPHFEHT
jgi:hypothetical protein